MALGALHKLSYAKLHNLISTPYHHWEFLIILFITELSMACMPLCMLLPLYRITLSPTHTSNSCIDITPMKTSWTPFLVPEHTHTFMYRWTWAFKHWYSKLLFRWDSTSVYQLTKESFELWYELNGTSCLTGISDLVIYYLFVHLFICSFYYFTGVVFTLGTWVEDECLRLFGPFNCL